MVKICKLCGEEKDQICFSRDKRAKDGLVAVCKYCENERLKHRRKERESSGLCIDCGITKAGEASRWCFKCQEKRKKQCANYRKKNSSELKRKNSIYQKNRIKALRRDQICNRCGKAPSQLGSAVCKSCLLKMKMNNWNLKLDIIEKLGNICSDCGEHRPEFLCVDHRHNNGKEERLILGSGPKFYRYLKSLDNLENYKLLCFNCNWKKYLQIRSQNKPLVSKSTNLKQCNVCKKIKSLDCFYKNNKRNIYETICKSCRSQKRKELNNQLKQKVLLHYGGIKCSCCGETDLDVLSINHTNGNGNQHRKKLGSHQFSGIRFYKWLIENDYPEGYNVLCLNCNLSLGLYGYCPHQS